MKRRPYFLILMLIFGYAGIATALRAKAAPMLRNE